jgi:CRISPR-associated protein Csx3
VAGGVVTGYALFPPEAGGAPPERYLLHPQDALTGVRYSLLPMMHAILDDMLSPEQAAAHVQLIEQHLLGPDGARLFDRPLPYRGGPMTLFQRAESSAFFGREIGVMYMHAHLRWAETLAHLGLAEKFFAALALAHPIALRERVPSASLRQANCYFSSSDAAFADRYDAQEHYARVASGEVPLDGGWRIYSSGPGIAIGLIVGCFLGVRRRARTLVLDPVLPASLRGLQACVELEGHEVQIDYRPGAQGCGPVWLELDGTPLHFTRGPNPYRCGAAEIDREALRQRLAVPPADGAMHRLVVHLG